MTEAWAYIDETQAPEASGTVGGQPFAVGALVLGHEVQQAALAAALGHLRDDPDSKRNPQDEATLGRGYFHASQDSKNAHSWLCRAIAEMKLDARFSVTTWSFEHEGDDPRSGFRLHRLATLLSILAVIGENFDVVHLMIARRAGSFDREHLDEWGRYYRKACEDFLVQHPELCTRYPKLRTQLVSNAAPGIQVCDFMLWAVQRAKFDGLEARGKRDWVTRLGLNVWAVGSMAGGPQGALRAELGRGFQSDLSEPSEKTRCRNVFELPVEERWDLLRSLVDDIHAAVRGQSPRIEHIGEEVRIAADMCRIAHLVPRETASSMLVDIVRAFLFVCDTLPTYEPSDPGAVAKAMEKKALAAGYLRHEVQLWLPDRFFLGEECRPSTPADKSADDGAAV